MNFRILGSIEAIEVIASGRGVRIREQLNKEFGRGRWRKLKGIATVQYGDGTIRKAEVHWFESHGIGRCYWKVKRHLD